MLKLSFIAVSIFISVMKVQEGVFGDGLAPLQVFHAVLHSTFSVAAGVRPCRPEALCFCLYPSTKPWDKA